MFVEEKKVGEATKIKPSEAIRKGHPSLIEDRLRYHYCALGAMWKGYGGRDMGLNRQIAREISFKHFMGLPRLKIADWLESQGY